MGEKLSKWEEKKVANVKEKRKGKKGRKRKEKERKWEIKGKINAK